MSLLLDLQDDRRDGKPWLPPDDRDVTAGRVVAGSIDHDGRPVCVQDGTMHQIAPASEDEARLYRCSECGVRAVWYPTNSMVAKRAFSLAWDSRFKERQRRGSESL